MNEMFYSVPAMLLASVFRFSEQVWYHMAMERLHSSSSALTLVSPQEILHISSSLAATRGLLICRTALASAPTQHHIPYQYQVQLHMGSR